MLSGKILVIEIYTYNTNRCFLRDPYKGLQQEIQRQLVEEDIFGKSRKLLNTYEWQNSDPRTAKSPEGNNIRKQAIRRQLDEGDFGRPSDWGSAIECKMQFPNSRSPNNTLSEIKIIRRELRKTLITKAARKPAFELSLKMGDRLRNFYESKISVF